MLVRAKALTKNKWIYGESVNYRDDPYIHDEKTKRDIPIDAKTITEFSKLYDSNNNRIYEGDIVEYVSFSSTNKPKLTISVVYNDYGTFKLTTNTEHLFSVVKLSSLYNGGYIKVIGNIYERSK